MTSARTRLTLLLPTILCLFLSLILTASCQATIEYAVSLDHPEQHLFRVTMTIPSVDGEVTVQMAAWDALYRIQDFSQRVGRVEAFVGSQPASIEKQDKQTWRIKGTGTIKVSYSTFWNENGPFASQLNSDYAFINPAMILFYVPSRSDEAVSLSLSFSSSGWHAAGSLLTSAGASGSNQFAIFQAASFEALADAPVEVGKIEEFDLRGVSPRVSVVIHGDRWRRRTVEENLKRICQYQLKMMEDAPFKRFLFILNFGKGAGGGGMEHAYSTAIAVFSDEYLPEFAAHEFFHLWNVKRIRPASLEPVDRSKEQYTRALWFAEGVTNAYSAYTLLRTRIWSKEQFFDDLGQRVTELENRPANRWQSAEQSSLDAWFEKYPFYNQPEYSVSYYTKGQVLGNLLDILIRDRTNNEKSLDDVMRVMNEDFAKHGRTYRESLDVQLTAEKVVGSSFQEFFQKYVAGTEPFPYEQTLALAGLEFKSYEQRRAALSFFADQDAAGQLSVRTVEPGGPAARAGLNVGDIILRWDGGEPPGHLGRWLNERQPGDLLKLWVRREEKEFQIQFPLGQTKESFYQVLEAAHPSEKARQIRDGILHGVTGASRAH